MTLWWLFQDRRSPWPAAGSSATTSALGGVLGSPQSCALAEEGFGLRLDLSISKVSSSLVHSVVQGSLLLGEIPHPLPGNGAQGSGTG